MRRLVWRSVWRQQWGEVVGDGAGDADGDGCAIRGLEFRVLARMGKGHDGW